MAIETYPRSGECRPADRLERDDHLLCVYVEAPTVVMEPEVAELVRLDSTIGRYIERRIVRGHCHHTLRHESSLVHLAPESTSIGCPESAARRGAGIETVARRNERGDLAPCWTGRVEPLGIDPDDRERKENQKE